MPEFPLFSSEPGEWPTDDEGVPATVEEYAEAVCHLVQMGLVEMRVDDHGEILLRATEAGHAAYAIEEAMKDLKWPEDE